MAILYLDCFSGISGDMMIGVLTDLGVTPSTFEWELSKIDLGDYHLHFEREVRGGISGIRFSVHGGATHAHSETSDLEEVREKNHHVYQHHHSHNHVHEPVQDQTSLQANNKKRGHQDRDADPQAPHDNAAPVRTLTFIEELL
ncbi:MAG: DUF111 family protein, partial [Verrucomicrobia bacterium]|nr:DUF111 family protein [Verrucomicrobiota bacterium]